MVKRIVLDMAAHYIEQNQRFLWELEKRYVLETGENAAASPDDTVVLTDKEYHVQKWKDYAVIGIEHDSPIKSTLFIIENLEDLTDYDLNLAFARKFDMPCVIAKNERFVLREAHVEDLLQLKQIYDNPGNVKYIPGMGDLESEKDKLLSYIRYMYGYYGYGLWVMQDNDAGTLIGRAGIEHREVDKELFSELAYLVREEYQRKGYAYQAAQMVLEFAKQCGIPQMITYIYEKNIPSIRLSEKLGFTRWKESTDGIKKYVIYRKEL